jgi:type II secretory pathway component PulK
MNRRGFALLTVLWALALASAVVGAAIATARLAIAASGNRITLARAAWAREACTALLLAGDTAAGRASWTPLSLADTIDLGRGTWCRVQVEDPGAKLNLNTAEPEALRMFLATDSLTDALLDWRDRDDLTRPEGAESGWYAAHRQARPRNDGLADLRELRLVRGFDSATVARLEPLVTTRGTGQINLGAAPPEVLATLPGMTDELARVLLTHRADGRVTISLDQTVGALSADARRVLLAHYAEFVRGVSLQPVQLVATVQGGVRGRAPVSQATLTLVPAPGRLAIVRRELE